MMKTWAERHPPIPPDIARRLDARSRAARLMVEAGFATARPAARTWEARHDGEKTRHPNIGAV